LGTAVIIPVHNGVAYTTRCLAALNGQSHDFEIVVVDDGSVDGTANFLRRAHPDVHVLRGNGALWWSGAINKGARYAIDIGAEVLVFFNNDNLGLCDGLISRLADLVRSTGACVSPVSVKEIETGTRQIVHAGGLSDWSSGRQTMVDEGLTYEPERRLERRDWLPGTALAVSSEVFTLLDGMNAVRYPQYRGDIDFTLRASAAGYGCLVARDAWVLNDQGQTGMNFVDRVPISRAISGLWSYRSSYNLREAVPFAFEHCPARLIPQYLCLYYARYFYACTKTRLPATVRLKLDQSRTLKRTRPASQQ
jgi:GT2 family glycosyltransferase